MYIAQQAVYYLENIDSCSLLDLYKELFWLQRFFLFLQVKLDTKLYARLETKWVLRKMRNSLPYPRICNHLSFHDHSSHYTHIGTHINKIHLKRSNLGPQSNLVAIMVLAVHYIPYLSMSISTSTQQWSYICLSLLKAKK